MYLPNLTDSLQDLLNVTLVCDDSDMPSDPSDPIKLKVNPERENIAIKQLRKQQPESILPLAMFWAIIDSLSHVKRPNVVCLIEIYA